ncbi:hypothetical protein ACIA47_12435 [Micromonospora sp. NPDC051227]|uniref:hypothetical protein n=1 Tax=Micromonospora sp. NPDC051227 TaxID=3364285 RepID=UPI0037A12173
MTTRLRKTFLSTLWEIVSTVWDVIVGTYDLVFKQTMIFKEVVEMVVANFIYLQNRMRGDFDALKTL